MKKLLFLFLFIIANFSVFAVKGILVKTTDYSFVDKWYKTIGSTAPRLISCDSLYKNQVVFITAIAGGFEIDDNNMANVDYSIKVFKPDGKLHYSNEKLELFKGKIEFPNNLQMSRNILNVGFGEEDPFGTYKIEIQIIDNIAKANQRLSGEISIINLPSYQDFEIDQKKFNTWMDNYYLNPQPVSALGHYIFYAKSPLSEDDSKFLPIFSIFLEVFRNNKFLEPQIINALKREDDRTKSYLIYLMYYAQLGTSDFYEQLEGIEKDIYLAIKDQPFTEIYDTINNPAQLDMLWSTFLTGGSYDPILKLIQTLDYSKYQGKLDAYKTSDQTEEDQQLAINNAIYDALVWSFESNCRQHSLVKNYATWAYQFEELSDIQRAELKKILEKLD